MRVILMKIGNSYILKHNKYSPVDFEIDGKVYKDVKSGDGILLKKPKRVRLILKKERIVKYGDLTPEEFQEKRKSFIKVVDEFGNPIFDNIDDEYRYKKFLEQHPPQWETYTEYEDCEIVEYNIQGRTDNPYIVPLRLLGEDPIKEDEVIYKYTPDPFKMVSEIASKLGFVFVEDKMGQSADTRGMKWSVPNHSRNNLEFLKINGRYVDRSEIPKFEGITYGTYEECLTRYNKHYNALKKVFERELRIIQAEAKPFDKKHVIETLRRIKEKVSRIKYSRKSVITPRQVEKELSSLIDRLLHE